MGYLGNTSGVNFLDVFTKDVFNGTGSQTAFTLSRDPGDEKAVEVFVNNVRQEPGSGKAYTVSGTTLTFSAAPSSATGNIYVIHVGRPMGTVDISNTAISNKTTITSLADTDKFLVHDSTDDLLKSVAKSNMPAGTWTLLTSVTASGASSIVIGGFSSTYKKYRLEIEGMTPSVDNVSGYLRVSANADGSSPVTSSNYAYEKCFSWTGNSNNSYNSYNSDADGNWQIISGLGSASGEAADFTFMFNEVTNTTKEPSIYGSGYVGYQDGTGVRVAIGGKLESFSSAVASLVFTLGSGNFEAGNFRLYGMV